jgi:hypothetical protein
MDAKHQKSNAHQEFEIEVQKHLDNLVGSASLSELVNNFAKYADRYQITKFLARYDLYRKILPIKGCIVECGVLNGNGLMTWAKLSSILEPVAFNRKIFGFDTFEGFPSVHEKDQNGGGKFSWEKGDLRGSSYEELKEVIRLYDIDRFIPHIPKVELIRGDFMKTSEAFLREHSYALISLLYLDFDLYEPTKKALEVFLPRMSKGSLLCFDEINNRKFPGETLAML